MKKSILIAICLFILVLSGCCQDRGVTFTAYKLERMYYLNAVWPITYVDKNIGVLYKNPHDVAAVKRAYKTTVKLFKEHGYDVRKYFITVDARFILVLNFDKKGTIMYGYYDDKKKKIYVSRYSSNDCDAFSVMNMLSTNPDLHESMIVHEMTHRFIHELFGTVSQIDHEYIAYVFQISSFPNYLKYLWGKKNKHLKAVKTEEITSEAYLKKPKSFGIRMYKHHVKHPEYINGLFKKLKGD